MQKPKKKIDFGESRPLNTNPPSNGQQPQQQQNQQPSQMNQFQNQGQYNVGGNPSQQQQQFQQFQQPQQQFQHNQQAPPQSQQIPFNQNDGNRFNNQPPQDFGGQQQQYANYQQQQQSMNSMNQAVNQTNNNSSNQNNNGFNPGNQFQPANSMASNQVITKNIQGFVFQQSQQPQVMMPQQQQQQQQMASNSQQQQYQMQQQINPSHQQNSNAGMVEETRIYNTNDAKQEIKKQKNTDQEEYEMQLQRKNKNEVSAYYKANIDSLNSDIYDCKQPHILDYQQIVEKTKIFCQRNQRLAHKLKESMENLLMYENSSNQSANKFDMCYERFSQQNNIPQQSSNNVNNVQQELNQFVNQEINIALPLDTSNLQFEINFLRRLKETYSLLGEVNGRFKASTQIPVKSLPLYSIFLYNFIIKKNVFHITVEYEDYYFFESQQNKISNENFVALLLYALKCEQRLVYLVGQNQNNHNEEMIDFEAISSFFQNNDINPTIQLRIQLGNLPDFNKKPIDKYKELLKHYEQGCKSQIFTLIIDGKWPENQFAKNFDESFNVLGKFQLWLIWMRQMQEKIIDFQLYIRARIKQDSMEQVKKEFSLYFTQKLKSFQMEIESSIFLNLATYLSCIPLSIQSKERAQLKTPVRQIIYSINDSSQVMIGNILCRKSPTSCCFYFKDSHDHYLKKVTATIVNSSNQQAALGGAAAAAQGYQQKCDSDFPIQYITIDKIYSFNLSDRSKLNEKLNQCGNLYDTLLINSLISQTSKKESSSSSALTIDLKELLSQ